ncbi:sulfate ABC transporter substrate-binding protein [Psychrobacter sp. ANT_WB68]|uniref:sulfate ABC transporter substrate-binding protein n=1 Tax=Psychrobacter sp. ANT_WB68 TaxID=2597355 RepID=UPI0011F29DA9|nr:sulfate ABC transporter substrate-binding protein [Psychrobacter sp. ANT_WB68]KAA0915884.1 sulfate ABC transporter substrate-binding protein [Psychrobacter sp. ANT_WB68]
MQATNQSIQKVSNKLEFSNAASFIENKSRQSQVASNHIRFSFKLGGVLAVAMLMIACSPTEATQNSTNDGTNSGTKDKQNISLLNVSYDVSRDFYKDYNSLFTNIYQGQHPDSKVSIQQSHGGASKQALSVANGLQADVVTLNQESDMNMLVKKGLVKTDWREAFPDNAVPYSTTMILLVRSGNPKNIKDWEDLARADVDVVMPNPKTSGTARYAFLGAYGSGLHKFKESVAQPQKTDAFMKKMLANVVTYDNGARAATTSFTQRGLGDVLITTENEAHLVATQHAKGQVDIVYPSYSITIHNPVAIVSSVTEKKGSTDAATAYLKALWDKPAQELMAQMYLRPSNKEVLAAHTGTLKDIQTFEPVAVFGDWDSIMETFFVDGGRFDQLAQVK